MDLPDRYAACSSSPESHRCATRYTASRRSRAQGSGNVTFDELSPPYGTIVADPPWSYTQAGVGPADAHYTTMSNASIAALPVSDLAAENAHLYLWATTPRLFASDQDDGVGPIEILRAWGFRYVTMLTWVKTGRVGMGFYFRGQTEHILFGVRGSAPIASDVRATNVIHSPRVTNKRGMHSRKPGAFGDLVEQVSPGPYLELFARSPRLGWDSWGHGYELGGWHDCPHLR